MSQTWDSVPEVKDGDPVSALVINGPLKALETRTERLRSIIDAMSAGQALLLPDVTVGVNVEIGTPVYWSTTDQAYMPGVAAIAAAGCGTHGILADSAYVTGVCVDKSSTTQGTIMLGGVLSGTDISAAVEGAVTPGHYYLSTKAGKLVRATPANGVYVLSVLGSGVIRVNPVPLDTITAHTHMRVPLTHGTVLSTTAGWSSVFSASIAPSGARYLYVPTAVEQVNLLLPLSPASAVLPEIDGVMADGAIVADANGLWWMATSEPTAHTAVIINYTQSQVATSQSVVTSLVSGSDLIEVVTATGATGSRGPLQVRFSGFNSSVTPDLSPTAIKSISAAGVTTSGPVLVGAESTHPSVDASVVNGVLRLTSTATDVALQGEPSISVVHGIQDEMAGVPYIGLPAGQSGSIGYRLELPMLTEGSYNLDLKLLLLATAAGTLPPLAVTYTVLPSVEDGATALVADGATGSTTVAYGMSTIARGAYIRANLTTKIPVTPGDTVFVSVARNDSSFAGTVGVVFARYQLTKA